MSVTHQILGYNPFRVKFIDKVTMRVKIETYQVVLTKRELEAEYDYIVFPD